MDLETGLYQPYRKPGDKPLYISALSNHPPQVFKNIPKGIEKRVSDNSSNQQIFEKAIPIYQTELDRCGYKYKLEYKQKITTTKNKKSRKRPITWFNPPYSLNVATNVAQEFLKLLDKHFPIGHPLRSVINRTTVKVSYRALPNMGAKIARHNAKILKNSMNSNHNNPPSCNCRNKEDCPIPWACNQVGVIYQATINNNKGESETYIGLASKFKSRHYKHKSSMETYNPENSTTLSTHFWKELDAGRQPSISWKIIEKNIPSYNPVTSKCQLCIREKFHITFNPNAASLNSRNELFSHCRHLRSKLLRPPD